MGKRDKEKNRGGKGSYNPQNINRIDKRIEKQQPCSKIVSSLVSHSLVPNSSSGDQFPYHGYIFMCNGITKTDCFKYRVFGLPAAKINVIDKIHPQMKIFLFDFDLRLLYGIFVPASRGEMSIEPGAFGGRFSAQIRFQIYKDCLPMPESVFRPIIRDNYEGSKFRQELTMEHVQKLMSLFRPVDMSPSQASISLSSVSSGRSNAPPGFGVYPSPDARLFTPRHQDLAVLHALRAEPTHHSQHIEKPHASVAKLQGMMSPPTTRQDCFPALPDEELYNRYATGPRNNQVNMMKRNGVGQTHHENYSQISTPSHGHGHGHSSTKSAAYWISVANESLQNDMYSPPQQNDMYPPHHQTPPIEDKEAAPIIVQHPPTEITDSSSAAATCGMVQTCVEDVPSDLPSSTSCLVPGYWTSVASQDPNQVYSAPSQWQQVENIPTNVVQTSLAPGNYPVAETDANQHVLSTGTTLNYYNYGTISGANGVQAQAHDSSGYYSGTTGVPAQVHDPAAAAYYSGTPGVPLQSHDPAAAYYAGTTGIPIQSHDPAAAAYYAGTTGIPIQSHDPAAAAYYSGTPVVPLQSHDPAAAYYSGTTGVLIQPADPAAAYYSGTNGVPAQAHDPATAYYYGNHTQAYDVAAYYSGTTGIPGQAHDQGGAYHMPYSSQAPIHWDPNQVGILHYPPPSGNNFNNVHSTVSLPGAPPV